MTTGQKINECRKKSGMTQEELAEKLGVTRQAVSKWEQDAAFPETDNVLEMCRLFSVSADELLFGKESEKPAPQEQGARIAVQTVRVPYRYEYVSERKLFGLPLVHINLGFGLCRAKGIIAIGNIATGFIAIGGLSVGLFALGGLALGLLVLGGFALGGVAVGGFALGLLALGGIATGLFAIGGVGIGYYALGGLAVGRYAFGGGAVGWLAVGLQYTNGTHTFLVPQDLQAFSDWLAGNDFSPGLVKFLTGLTKLLSIG